MSYQADLEKLLGLKTVSYKYNLSKTELFHEAIAHDRGRVTKGGANDEIGRASCRERVSSPV